ncbi:MAG: hypothetical protein JKY08_05300 [Flavobacteriaceae bacterium]|nr:hypothetical protein [Flavobacteriaceae bacterium]
MKKIICLSTLISLIFITLSCSGGGDDEVVEMFTVTGTVNFTDPAYWSDQEDIRFGVFKIGESQALSSVKIIKTATGKGSFTLKNITKGTYDFKIYLAKNQLNILNLIPYATQSISKNSVLDEINMTLVSYDRVQKQVFNSCMLCHGASSGEIAANLNLTKNESYSNLVGVSSKNSSLLRVKPFSVTESFMINVLQMKGLNFDHPASVNVSEGSLKLIENWIQKGALND